MRCCKCLHENEEKAIYCVKCGNKLNANHQYNYNTSSIGCGTIILIFIVIVSFLFVIILLSSEDDISDGPIVNRAKTCEDTDVKDLVIQIFKENNNYYRAINKKSINSIVLNYPSISRYDKDIDKYFCNGTIIMEANTSGFLPSSYDYNNVYYSLIKKSIFDDTLYKFSKYELNVEYESQISEGRTLVRSTTEGGDFSGNGGTIVNQAVIERERKYQQQKQKEINDTHMNLPD